MYPVYTSFLLGFSMAYFISEIIPLPIFWYYPLEHRWEFTSSPSQGLMMGWYGKVLLSFCVATLSSLSLFALLTWRPQWKQETLSQFLELAAMASAIFTLYYIARSLVLASGLI